MSAFPGVPVDATYHLVLALAGLLTPLLGGLAAAAAIVLFTMAIRLLILPLSYRAMRGLAAQARIAPRVQALRRQHAGQPDRLQRELTRLYKSEGTSMFAGCLPLLLQWPFLSVMYLLFRSAKVGGVRNALLGHDLFSAPLGSHWLGGAGPLSTQGAVFAGLFLLLAGIGWLSARMARRLAPAEGSPANGSPAEGSPANGSLRARSPESVRSTHHSGSRASGWPDGSPAGAADAAARLAPFITVVVAAFAPLAAGLYLVTSAAWTLAERTLLPRAGHHP
ncbi:MAG TPA: membrane protein insertase YidC [Streptosporangiaceae bacterium]|nr:membrane protein insertase YidC [Streptosporangiaceae bacterium]